MKTKLTPSQLELLNTLKKRFEKNKHRHPELTWAQVEDRIMGKPNCLKALQWMEDSGGEPDVTKFTENEELVFMDCSKESPKGRRSLCYDRKALEERKEFKPENSVMDLVKEYGLSLLNEEDYRHLQSLEEFDLKTSSWVLTSESVRKLGGAFFCDRRYNQVFLYHNGASSYYAARGFRCSLIV